MGLNSMRKVNQEENYYDYLERKYHSNEVKEFSLGKKILLVLVASSIGFAGFHLIKNAVTNVSAKEAVVTTVEEPDEVYEVIPTVEPVVETIAPFEKPTATPMVTPEPTPVSYDNGYNRGDTVVSNADVNLRLNTTKKSNKIGVLPKGSVVDRILTDGDWDLIRYGDQIAYVHADYTDESEVD